MGRLPKLARVSIGVLSLALGITRARAVEPADAVATIPKVNCDKNSKAVVVSYRLVGAIGPAIRDALESGETVKFVHELTVSRRRKSWFSRSLVTESIEVTVGLDTLTHEYTLGRKRGGRELETSTTDKREEAERWLSVMKEVPVDLPPGSTDSGTLEVKVKATYGRDFLLFLFPWSLTAVGKAECR